MNQLPNNIEVLHNVCVVACELLRAQGIRARVTTHDKTSVGYTNIVIPKSYTTNSYHQVLGKTYAHVRHSADELAAFIKAEEIQRITSEFAETPHD